MRCAFAVALSVVWLLNGCSYLGGVTNHKSDLTVIKVSGKIELPRNNEPESRNISNKSRECIKPTGLASVNIGELTPDELETLYSSYQPRWKKYNECKLSACISYGGLEYLDIAKYPVEKQKEMLFSDADEWRKSEICVTNTLKSRRSIEDIYLPILNGTACSPRPVMLDSFDSGSDLLSEYDYYVVLLECAENDLARRVYLLNKIIAALDGSHAQDKWEQYAGMQCGVNNVMGYKTSKLHPREKLDEVGCINRLVSDRVEIIYNLEYLPAQEELPESYDAEMMWQKELQKYKEAEADE
jgi:hypothetical protein